MRPSILISWTLAVLALTFASSASAAVAAAPAARNYDCTKAGNANKAACKGAAPVVAAKPAAKPVAKPVAAAAKPATVAAAKPAERNYDCTKAGNPNKTACK